MPRSRRPASRWARPLRAPLSVLLVAATGAVALSAWGGSEQLTATAQAGTQPATATTAAAHVKLKVGTISGASSLALYAAVDKGYFAQQGLDVTLNFLSGGPANVAATVGGSQQFMYGDIYAWALAVQQKFPLKLVAGANTPNYFNASKSKHGGNGVLVKKGGGISSPKDLIGKKLGVSPTPQSSVFAKLWLRKNGVDPSKVTLVPIAPGPAQLAAFSSGQVPAIVLGSPGAQQAVGQLGAYSLGDVMSVVPQKAAIAGYIATKSYVASHGDVVAKFTKAVYQGAVWANHASAQDRAALLLKVTKINLTALQKQVPGLVNDFRYPTFIEGPIDRAATQQSIDLAHQVGVIPQPFSLAANIA